MAVEAAAADEQTPSSTVQAGTPPPAAIPEKSVAVLPFIDMSEKKDQEYFSDGLSEELIDLLAQVQDLRVPARTSSFAFKGKADDVPSIAQKLRVAHVLEGSVRKAGNTLRVTVQLIRADNGYHLWSKTYDRDIKDIFKVQDEIAAAVVEVLKAKLAPAAGRGRLPQLKYRGLQPVFARQTVSQSRKRRRLAAGDRRLPQSDRTRSRLRRSLCQSCSLGVRPRRFDRRSQQAKGKRWPTPRGLLPSHRRRPTAMRRAEFCG